MITGLVVIGFIILSIMLHTLYMHIMTSMFDKDEKDPLE